MVRGLAIPRSASQEECNRADSVGLLMLPLTQKCLWMPLFQCVIPLVSWLTQEKEMDLVWGLGLDSTPYKAHKASPLDSEW